MSDFLTNFYDLFGLTEFINADSMTLLDLLKNGFVLFIACIFVLVMFRFIMEFVKIFLNWNYFK